MRKLLAAVAAAGLAAAAAAQDPKPKTVPAAPIQKKEAPKRAKVEPTLKVGDAAPPLKADQWLQGAEVKALEPGKTYVVEFWATWCGPCIVMMPHMAEMQHEYRDKGVTFVGFTSKDRNGNNEESVAKFVSKRGPKLGYTFAYQDTRDTNDAWMTAAGQGGIPCCFVVNKEGKIAYIGHPMYLDVVLPKVAAGTWGEADVAKMEEVEKDVNGVFQALGGRDAEAGLKTFEEFRTKYPKLAGIPYFTASRLNAMIKLKNYADTQQIAEEVIAKAVKQSDPLALQTVASVMRSPAAKERKELLAVAVKAADALVAVSGDQDVNALTTAATTYDAAGDKAKAAEFRKKAVPAAEKEIKGDKDWQGMLRVSTLCEQAGDKAKAVEWAKKAIPLVEGSIKGDKDWQGMLRLADAYAAAGDKAKAKEQAEKALAAVPEGNKNLRDFVERQAKKHTEEKDEK